MQKTTKVKIALAEDAEYKSSPNLFCFLLISTTHGIQLRYRQGRKTDLLKDHRLMVSEMSPVQGARIK